MAVKLAFTSSHTVWTVHSWALFIHAAGSQRTAVLAAGHDMSSNYFATFRNLGNVGPKEQEGCHIVHSV